MAAVFFNNVFLFKPFTYTDKKIKQARSYFENVERPFRVVIREEYSHITDGMVEDVAFKKVDSVPMMIHRTLSDLNAPTDLDWKPVTDTQTLKDYRSVMASAFAFPDWLLEKVLADALLNEEHLVMVVGYEQGIACTGAMLIQQQDLAGIYWVGTKQGYERKGLAAKATTQAILLGRDRGCTWSILQASEKGQPVYERMGFETIAHYHYHVYQPALADA
jgi:GNAT superfamily N-acetyltransferase